MIGTSGVEIERRRRALLQGNIDSLQSQTMEDRVSVGKTLTVSALLAH